MQGKILGLKGLNQLECTIGLNRVSRALLYEVMHVNRIFLVQPLFNIVCAIRVSFKMIIFTSRKEFACLSL